MQFGRQYLNMLPPSSTLSMETADSFKTLVPIDKRTCHYYKTFKLHIHKTPYYSLNTPFITLLLNMCNLNHIVHACEANVPVLISECQT